MLAPAGCSKGARSSTNGTASVKVVKRQLTINPQESTQPPMDRHHAMIVSLAELPRKPRRLLVKYANRDTLPISPVAQTVNSAMLGNILMRKGRRLAIYALVASTAMRRGEKKV